MIQLDPATAIILSALAGFGLALFIALGMTVGVGAWAWSWASRFEEAQASRQAGAIVVSAKLTAKHGKLKPAGNGVRKVPGSARMDPQVLRDGARIGQAARG